MSLGARGAQAARGGLLALPAPSSARVSQAGSAQFSQLQLFKHEMQHRQVTQGYIANQILHVSWCEFRPGWPRWATWRAGAPRRGNCLHKGGLQVSCWPAPATALARALLQPTPPPRGLLTERRRRS